MQLFYYKFPVNNQILQIHTNCLYTCLEIYLILLNLNLMSVYHSLGIYIVQRRSKPAENLSIAQLYSPSINSRGNKTVTMADLSVRMKTTAVNW